MPSAILLTALAACSSSTSGGGSATPDQAATDAATALCTKYVECEPFSIQLVYGDIPTCASRIKPQIMDLLAATGTSDTPSQIESCGQAIASASCDSVLGNKNLPDACKAKPGTLANGTACGDDSQCVNAHCNIPPEQSCGSCTTAKVAVGGTCAANGDCDGGSVCVGTVCVQPGAAGATCDGTHPCTPTLVCKAGTCGTPDEAGAACVRLGDTCDNRKGATCNGASGTCQTVTIAQAGQPCGLINGAVTVCAGSGDCPGFAPPAKVMGTCQAPAADGASCDAINGPSCAAPSKCVSGTCKSTDVSTCK